MFRSAVIMILVVATVSAVTRSVTGQVPEYPVLPSVHAAMRKCVDDREVAGSVTLVATGDGIVHLDAVGKADVAANRPMSTDRLFWIASMTKPVTGAAVMMMQEEGKLKIDDLVEKFIPNSAASRRPRANPRRSQFGTC